MAVDGDLAVRPLRDSEEDYALLAGWFRDPRLLEWYHGRTDPFDLAKVKARYGPRARGEDATRSHVVERAGVPVGYVQCYPLEGSAETRSLVEDPRDGWGIDYFLGDPGLWGRGIGARMIAAFVRHLFEDRGAARVVSDPRVENVRSVRVLEKCGFRRVRVLPAHEKHEGEWRDCVLMEVLRP